MAWPLSLSLTPPFLHTHRSWFWPAKGSGIYINVGKTRTFARRGEAARAGYGTHVLINRSKSISPTTGQVVLPRDPLPLDKAWLDQGLDLNYAARANLDGYDTVQLLRGNGVLFGDAGQTFPAFEIVRATDECVRGSVTGPCVSGLRRGFGATEECACDDRRHFVLQCAG